MEQTALVRYHKTPEQKAAIVAAFKESGLNRNEFADRHGLKRTTLLGWLRNERERSARPAGPELIEVTPGRASPTTAGGYRLHFPRGLVLEISRGLDSGELRSLVQLLQSL
jgi:hypothetical protein